VTAQPNEAAWARLFRVGCSLIRQVNSPTTIIDHWTFGGGTALMLQIDHRESRDVDFFLRDPQLLPFLDPETHDFQFEILPSDYGGDGTNFLKLSFEDIGEIDFIVAQTMTASPTIQRVIEGQDTLVETTTEIIAKKIVYRGANIMPRDIFDIAAAAEFCADQIVAELRPYRSEVQKTIDSLQRLNPEFVSDAISQLTIRQPFRGVATNAIERTKEVLGRV
jgi:hypothetical protein